MNPELKIALGSHSYNGQIDLIESTKTIQDVLDELGIDVVIQVTLIDSQDLFTVNEVVCCLPEKLSKEIEEAAQLIVADHDALKGTEWQMKLRETVWLHVATFFPIELLTDYIPALNAMDDERFRMVRKQCHDVIRELLNLKISLKQKSLIAEISHNYLISVEIRWDDFREELIAALSTNEIDLYFNQSYFEQMISASGKDNLMEMMRVGLFYENGIQYPGIQLNFDESLPFNSYCFKLNAYKSFPYAGLIAVSQMVVNEGSERLAQMGIEGIASINPAYGNSVTIIDAVHREKLDGIRSVTWDAFGFFIVHFSVVLRKYAHLFVHLKLTNTYLQRMKASCPKIISLIEQQKLESFTSIILRLLVKEGLSIQHLRLIFEAILERECIAGDGHHTIIFDERIAVDLETMASWKNEASHVLEFVRMRLKKKISHKYSLGTGTINVCLIDAEIENKIYATRMNDIGVDTDFVRNVCKAISLEVAEVFNSSQLPILLTTMDIRPKLKKMLELCHPEIVVLSYQELSPDTGVNALARVSL